ncbi:hypothetical protein TNCV_1932321 [Trichonephila clavipes]|nr:hypothetical protein TNCV_1932321 [Trichonephila clavipes]
MVQNCEVLSPKVLMELNSTMLIFTHSRVDRNSWKVGCKSLEKLEFCLLIRGRYFMSLLPPIGKTNGSIPPMEASQKSNPARFNGYQPK